MKRRIMAILIVVALLVNSNLAMAATTAAERISQRTSDMGTSQRVVSVALEEVHSAAITKNGDLYGWGLTWWMILFNIPQ